MIMSLREELKEMMWTQYHNGHSLDDIVKDLKFVVSKTIDEIRDVFDEVHEKHEAEEAELNEPVKFLGGLNDDS